MILGHKKQRRYLQKITESGEIPHSLLFCGQENLGKKTVAIEFLKSFLGQDVFHHPDFIFIEPLENEIQISQIRDLNWKLSLKPFLAPFKAVIIDKAHLMNQEAQNCFLKTLEEPKGNAVLILVSAYPELLLPTIRSRTQRIKFYPVDKKEIEDYLKAQKLSEAEVEMFSAFSIGRPGLALSFLLNSEKLEGFKSRIGEITGVLNSDLCKRFQYAKNLSQEEDLKEILHVWLNFFRNILLSKLNLQKSWVILKKDYSLEKLKVILKNIQTTIFLISTTNINQKLALELLFIEL